MLKVALIQLMVKASKSDNLLNACSKIKSAADRGAKLICLPECFNCPYGVKYFPEYCENSFDGKTSQTLSELAKKHSVWLVGGTIPESKNGKIYNTSIVYNPNGELIGTYSKLHLFDIDIPDLLIPLKRKITFKESETLTSGNQLLSFDIPTSGDKTITVGIGICYDIRFPELAHIYSRQRNCSLLLYPGAFNLSTGPLHWELLGRARAMDNQCYVGLCSTARDTNADYVSYGYSLVADPWGKVIGSLTDKEDILHFELNLNEMDNVRSAIPVRQQRREDVYSTGKEL